MSGPTGRSVSPLRSHSKMAQPSLSLVPSSENRLGQMLADKKYMQRGHSKSLNCFLLKTESKGFTTTREAGSLDSRNC